MRFAMVPADLLGADINHAAFRVLVALMSYSDSDGRCYPAVATIAESVGMDLRGARRRISELVAAGLVERTERPGRSSYLKILPRVETALPGRVETASPGRNSPDWSKRPYHPGSKQPPTPGRNSPGGRVETTLQNRPLTDQRTNQGTEPDCDEVDSGDFLSLTDLADDRALTALEAEEVLRAVRLPVRGNALARLSRLAPIRVAELRSGIAGATRAQKFHGGYVLGVIEGKRTEDEIRADLGMRPPGPEKFAPESYRDEPDPDWMQGWESDGAS